MTALENFTQERLPVIVLRQPPIVEILQKYGVTSTDWINANNQFADRAMPVLFSRHAYQSMKRRDVNWSCCVTPGHECLCEQCLDRRSLSSALLSELSGYHAVASTTDTRNKNNNRLKCHNDGQTECTTMVNANRNGQYCTADRINSSYLVVSNMCAFRQSISGHVMRVRIDDANHLDFWLNVDIDCKDRRVVGRIQGRHVVADALRPARLGVRHCHEPYYAPVEGAQVGHGRPNFKGKVVRDGDCDILQIWDTAHPLFEVRIDITKECNLFRDKK